MTDLTNVLGGPWAPPVERRPDPPEQQLAEAMLRSGITPPDHIRLDGEIHRFSSGTKGKPGKGDKSGWYVGWTDNVPAGRFGCWRADIEQTWRADIGRTLTPIEEMAHARRMAEAQELRKQEQERKAQNAADIVSEIWANASLADSRHPYLQKKGVQPHGARVTGDGRLVVPMYQADGALASLQYIDSQGEKRYHQGAPTSGAFFLLGSVSSTIYITEGFATGATVHEVSGEAVAIAYSASNLPKVAKMLREQHGQQCRIVVVADHDEHGVGQKYADKAAQESGSISILPPIPGMDANDYHQAGHDLMDLLSSRTDGWLVPASEFSAKPAPIRWLIKRWLQADALIMIHGPSGGGKTFVLIDWLCHVASDLSQWFGQKVATGDVIYLAGEGHHGLRGRIAAWMQHHQKKDLRLWISKDGCDLNTPEGYQRVVESVRALGVTPLVIAVDTLHRFLAGDENSAQDAKTMIDACAGLMREFNCSVVLVHHTGVSEESQHRARGSSAWKGALEIEVSVKPTKDQIALIQRKAKDAELTAPIHLMLQSVPIDGWYDEDGEPVSSAVLVEGEAPVERKSDSKLATFKKIIREAWIASGGESQDDKPYLTKSALMHYLTTKLGKTEATAKTYIKPSKENLLIGALTLGGIIEQCDNGWIVCDSELSSSMFLFRGTGKNGEN